MARKRARLSLESLKSQKPASEAATAAKSAGAPRTRKKTEEAASEARIGLTVRLSPAAHRQLKHLCADENKKAHDFIIEGLNQVFKKHGKPPIA